MNRKDITVGMRVVPSGRGFTKYWNISRYTGAVKEIGQRYIKVAWDGFSHIPIDDNIMPVHLSPAGAQSNNASTQTAGTLPPETEPVKSERPGDDREPS